MPNDAADTLDIDVVVPVYNEALTLDRSVRALHAFLVASVPERWRITIADNASTDATPVIAQQLIEELSGLALVRLEEQGRGRALKHAWGASSAKVLVYLDEDLSTELRAIRPLVAPLLSGHSDLSIGTRLAHSSRVVRGGKREFISRSYNLIVRAVLGARFTDAQCGFKAIRSDVADRLLPLVKDMGWFFDTELLVLAEHAGLRIHEVPVDWVDDPHSSVNIVKTASADMKGIVRLTHALITERVPVEQLYADLGRHPLVGGRQPTLLSQAVRFCLVGGASTVAFALLYLLFQLALPSQAADFAALLIATVANTAANRLFTFGVRGRRKALTHHAQGLVVFAIAWGMTSGSLLCLQTWDPHAGAGIEIITLTLANVLATAVRFVLLRFWVFGSRSQRHSGVPTKVAPLQLKSDA